MVTQTPAEMSALLGTSAPIRFDTAPTADRPLTAAQLDAARALEEKAEVKEKLAAMAEVVRAGGTVMPVAAEVAHAQEVGQRELRRRRQRRKAATAARKRNR